MGLRKIQGLVHRQWGSARQLYLGGAPSPQEPVGAAEEVQEAEETKKEQLERREKTWGMVGPG